MCDTVFLYTDVLCSVFETGDFCVFDFCVLSFEHKYPYGEDELTA